MSNGNLLNSLLAINGANASTGKSTSPQKAKEAGDGFQKALDQVRPEVAARQDERRISPAKARVEPQRPAVKAVEKRDLPANASPVASQHARNKVESTEPKARNNTARTSAEAAPPNTPDDTSSAASEHSAAFASVEQNTAAETPLVAADTVVAQVLTDLASVPVAAVVALPAVAGELGTELQLVVEAGVKGDVAGESPAVAGNPLTDLLTAVQGAESLPGDLLESDSQLPTDAVLALGTHADGQLLASAAAGTELSSTLTGTALPHNQLQNSPLQTGLSLAAAQGSGLGAAGATSSAAVLLDELALADVMATETASGEPLTPESGELALLDNPDFLLLNSKAALNKLSEAALISLDKTVPDSAKSLLAATASPALEALSRAAESQSPAARAFVVQTGVAVPMGQPQWGQAVGEKVLWLAAQNVSAAEIRLDPPELGPMQVRVSVNQEQASVTFTSPHPMVREVLDQQLNRLREMFAEQGLNLVNVDVSDKSFAQQEQEKRESGNVAKTLETDEDELLPIATSTMPLRLVDHYA